MFKNRKASTNRDQLFKYAFIATMMWVAGIVFTSIGSSMALDAQTKFNDVGIVVKWLGTISLLVSWIIIIIFGIFTLVASLEFKDQEKLLGIICAVLCFVIPVVGIIMAWILYYKR